MFVKFLPESLTEDELKEVFSKAGKILGINLFPKSVVDKCGSGKMIVLGKNGQIRFENI